MDTATNCIVYKIPYRRARAWPSASREQRYLAYNELYKEYGNKSSGDNHIFPIKTVFPSKTFPNFMSIVTVRLQILFFEQCCILYLVYLTTPSFILTIMYIVEASESR